MMIEWSENEFGTGDKIIDRQHKMFIEAYNKIKQHADNKDFKEVVNSLKFFIDYVHEHFEYEEKTKDLDENHIAAHKSMEKLVQSEMMMYVHDGNNYDINSLVISLRTWISNHLMSESFYFQRQK